MADRALVQVRAQFADAQTIAQQEIEGQRLVEENLRLQAELHAAREQLRLLAGSNSDDHSLLAVECVPARILGTQAQSFLARHRLLDAGRSRGVGPEDLVLRPATVLVDRGADRGIEDGQVVLAGSCVWGKITSAGSHTSTVCPVTEPGYRDLVRLAAPSADGLTLRIGAKGILEGTGEPLARLCMIETTEPVARGDLVYSMAGQGFVDMPLLCGRVVEVERLQGAGHWEIRVAPAVDDPPDRLAILCPTPRSIEVARREMIIGQEPRSE
jgi:cell shape-determining protein MreC